MLFGWQKRKLKVMFFTKILTTPYKMKKITYIILLNYYDQPNNNIQFAKTKTTKR